MQMVVNKSYMLVTNILLMTLCIDHWVATVTHKMRVVSGWTLLHMECIRFTKKVMPAVNTGHMK